MENMPSGREQQTAEIEGKAHAREISLLIPVVRHTTHFEQGEFNSDIKYQLDLPSLQR